MSESTLAVFRRSECSSYRGQGRDALMVPEQQFSLLRLLWTPRVLERISALSCRTCIGLPPQPASVWKAEPASMLLKCLRIFGNNKIKSRAFWSLLAEWLLSISSEVWSSYVSYCHRVVLQVGGFLLNRALNLGRVAQARPVLPVISQDTGVPISLSPSDFLNYFNMPLICVGSRVLFTQPKLRISLSLCPFTSYAARTLRLSINYLWSTLSAMGGGDREEQRLLSMHIWKKEPLSTVRLFVMQLSIGIFIHRQNEGEYIHSSKLFASLMEWLSRWEKHMTEDTMTVVITEYILASFWAYKLWQV